MGVALVPRMPTRLWMVSSFPQMASALASFSSLAACRSSLRTAAVSFMGESVVEKRMGG